MLESKNIQKYCAWSGIVGMTLFFMALWPFSGFLPPPAPSLGQQEVVALYQQNTTGIRIGMILMMTSSMFISPMVAAISVQIWRIEKMGKGAPILTFTQLSTGTVNILFFILPGILFLVTAYRPDRDPEITYLMNDLCWIMTIMVWPPGFMQNISVAIAALSDKSPQPVFPRWLGFFSIWVAILLVPGSLIPFFKVGPFAWNGILAFWLPASAFGTWYFVMTVMLLKAVNRQAQEA